MDSKTSGLDFAIIGHQDSWQKIQSFINGIRTAELEQLSIEKIKDVFGYIPPREIFKIKVKSQTGKEITGVYLETFIDPDQLDVQHLRTNINKVRKAIMIANKLNVKLVTLGGFASIVLEGNVSNDAKSNSKLTTGNTLTSAFIIKGIEKSASQLQINLEDSNILIIGATGDIGLACTHYLKSKVNQLLLCARNKNRLEKLSSSLSAQNINVDYNTSLNALVPKADIIISVASSKDIEIKNTKRKVIICDAGYPKNLEEKILNYKGVYLFHGGMGQVKYGYKSYPDYANFFYNYPTNYIAHGCILEAMVLAFEEKFENYSIGKGNIKENAIDNIYKWSLKHGIDVAPFYNVNGLW